MEKLVKAPTVFSKKGKDKKPTVFTYISKSGSVPSTATISPEDEVYMSWTDDDGEVHEELRSIRYCRGERSIFVDEQSEKSKRTDIEFYQGTLVVSPLETTLLKFMTLTNFNEANSETRVPGSPILFRANDAEKKAEEENQKQQRLVKLKSFVYGMEDKEAIGLAKVFFGSSYKVDASQMNTLKQRFTAMIDKDAERFEKVVNSDLRKRKLALIEAVEAKVISVDEEKKVIYNLIGKKSEIFKANSYCEDVLEEFADLSLSRDEYKTSYDEIQKLSSEEFKKKSNNNEYLETAEYELFTEALEIGIISSAFGYFQNKDKRIGRLGKTEKESVEALRLNAKAKLTLKEFVDAKKKDLAAK